jgi:hypothetical protein
MCSSLLRNCIFYIAIPKLGHLAKLPHPTRQRIFGQLISGQNLEKSDSFTKQLTSVTCASRLFADERTKRAKHGDFF